MADALDNNLPAERVIVRVAALAPEISPADPDWAVLIVRAVGQEIWAEIAPAEEEISRRIDQVAALALPIDLLSAIRSEVAAELRPDPRAGAQTVSAIGAFHPVADSVRATTRLAVAAEARRGRPARAEATAWAAVDSAAAGAVAVAEVEAVEVADANNHARGKTNEIKIKHNDLNQNFPDCLRDCVRGPSRRKRSA